MRIRPYILPVVCIGILAPSTSRADGNDPSVPSGYVWCALEHLSGKVLIPTGWFCRGIRFPAGSGYEVTEDEVVSKNDDYQSDATNRPIFFAPNRLSKISDYRTGITIKVISGPFWTKSRISKLADGLFEDRRREGRMSVSLNSSSGTYSARSFDREGVEAVGNVIETKHFTELILQDTETPTLVLVTFDCPLSAWPQNKDHCEKFFATLSLFQDGKQENHSPYSAHAPSTAAAAEAAAQVVAADHDTGGTFVRIRGPH